MRILIGKLLLLIADIILLVNFMMYLNFTDFLGTGYVYQYWDFNHYYFGVTSLFNWFNEIPSSVTNYHPIEAVSNILLSFAGSEFIREYSNATWLYVLANLVVPISPTIAIINESIRFFGVCSDLLIHVFRLFGGYYNLPIDDMSHHLISITSWDFDLSKYLFIF